MIKVTILNYLRKVKFSDSRRPQYFTLKDKLPEKYEKDKRYVWRKNPKGEIYLYDSREKVFVVANPNSVGTPSYQAIAGNEIYARMHERKRMKIVEALKNDFKRHLIEQRIQLSDDYFPLSVSMELRSQYGYADWDLDNLWIYHKCFLDSLTDLGIIPDDNVLYIRQAGQTNFFPITEYEKPSMTFILEKSDLPKHPRKVDPMPLNIRESNEGEAGTVDFNGLTGQAVMFTGKKKILFGAAKKCVREVMLHALNNFKTVFVPNTIYTRYSQFFKENMFAGHIKVIVTPDNE
jgi:Holliday junction resolvase RusA-like endonuclease